MDETSSRIEWEEREAKIALAFDFRATFSKRSLVSISSSGVFMISQKRANVLLSGWPPVN